MGHLFYACTDSPLGKFKFVRPKHNKWQFPSHGPADGEDAQCTQNVANSMHKVFLCS